jgi:death-on-curing protein
VTPAADKPRWVDRLVVEAIHFDLLRGHGGLPGLRDEAALESALARPRQCLAYEPGCGTAELAAAYGWGLARSHPFNDGNKRVALLTMGVFLGLNGFEIEAPETEVVTVMVDLAAGLLTEQQLAEWLRSRMVASANGTPG